MGHHDAEAISDHIPIVAIISDTEPRRFRGRLKPGPKWTQPSGLSGKEWKAELEQRWFQLVDIDSSFDEAVVQLTSQPGDVQDDWDSYMSLLNQFFKTSYKEMAQTNPSEQVRLYCQNGFRQAGARSDWKGKPAVWQKSNQVVSCSNSKQKSEKER